MEKNNHQSNGVEARNGSHLSLESTRSEDTKSLACIFPTLIDGEPRQSCLEQTAIDVSIPLGLFSGSREDVTINRFLETLWCIVLSRFTDTDDLLFGIDTFSPSLQNGNGPNGNLGSDLKICRAFMDRDRLVWDLLHGKHLEEYPISAFSPDSYNTGIVFCDQNTTQNDMSLNETKEDIESKRVSFGEPDIWESCITNF